MTDAEPQPMRCPECGGDVVVELEASVYDLPVYGTDRGAAWLGPWRPDEEEWEIPTGEVGCTDCDWTEKVHDWELGGPIS